MVPFQYNKAICSKPHSPVWSLRRSNTVKHHYQSLGCLSATAASGINGAFSIQQSQSAWSTEPLSIGNRENSVVVQPLTLVDAIWKGDEWSRIPTKIKLHSSFLNLCDQAKRSNLFLAASVESARSGTLLRHGNGKVWTIFCCEGSEEVCS
jgi:hypothetical protein